MLVELLELLRNLFKSCGYQGYFFDCRSSWNVSDGKILLRSLERDDLQHDLDRSTQSESRPEYVGGSYLYLSVGIKDAVSALRYSLCCQKTKYETSFSLPGLRPYSICLGVDSIPYNEVVIDLKVRTVHFRIRKGSPPLPAKHLIFKDQNSNECLDYFATLKRARLVVCFNCKRAQKPKEFEGKRRRKVVQRCKRCKDSDTRHVARRFVGERTYWFRCYMSQTPFVFWDRQDPLKIMQHERQKQEIHNWQYHVMPDCMLQPIRYKLQLKC